jgi:4-hydroxybenzoate polyprenyltransferase
MNNLREYFKERFPLSFTITYSIATAAMLVGISTDGGNLTALIGIAISFLFFMLRTRVTDEFKDASHDNANYPNRPVQRGLITKKQLVTIGLISLLLEITGVVLAATATANPMAGWLYLLIMAYSVLTAFEFFATEFLDRHFNLYFLTHQAVFLLYPIWLFNMFGTGWTLQSIAGGIAFIVLMASLEVMRKYEIRKNPAGEIVKDTYLAVWGAGAFWMMFLSAALCSVLFGYLKDSFWFFLSGSAVCLAMLTFRNKDMAVRGIVVLGYLVTSGMCYLL